jgi:hypothetical protein
VTSHSSPLSPRLPPTPCEAGSYVALTLLGQPPGLSEALQEEEEQAEEEGVVEKEEEGELQKSEGREGDGPLSTPLVQPPMLEQGGPLTDDIMNSSPQQQQHIDGPPTPLRVRTHRGRTSLLWMGSMHCFELCVYRLMCFRAVFSNLFCLMSQQCSSLLEMLSFQI